MNGDNRSIGAAGCQYVIGVGPHAVKAGHCAWSATSYADDTKIASVTPGEVVGVTGSAVTNESWMAKALNDNKFVAFSNPIVSITLTAETDIMMLWLEPLRKS